MGLLYIDAQGNYTNPADSGLKYYRADGTWADPSADYKYLDATGNWSAPELGGDYLNPVLQPSGLYKLVPTARKVECNGNKIIEFTEVFCNSGGGGDEDPYAILTVKLKNKTTEQIEIQYSDSSNPDDRWAFCKGNATLPVDEEYTLLNKYSTYMDTVTSVYIFFNKVKIGLSSYSLTKSSYYDYNDGIAALG